VPLRPHRIATTLTLILTLGALPAFTLTNAANAAVIEVAAPTAPSETPRSTAPAVDAAPSARTTPALNLEYLGQDRFGRAQLQVTISPEIFPDSATDYPNLTLLVDGSTTIKSDGFGDDGVSPNVAELSAGRHTVRAVTSENSRFNAAESAGIEFDVSGPKITKLTLIPPKKPYGNVKYPYIVKVAPSHGSTARVNLSQCDNGGRLEYIGVGYLKDGEVTINAAALPGQRRIVAEFTGDDMYAVSGAAVDIFFPLEPAAAADPPAAPAPSVTPAATDPSTAGRSIAGSVATTATGELAYTGSDPWPGAVLATALLAAGVALRLLVRRRQH